MTEQKHAQSAEIVARAAANQWGRRGSGARGAASRRARRVYIDKRAEGQSHAEASRAAHAAADIAAGEATTSDAARDMLRSGLAGASLSAADEYGAQRRAARTASDSYRRRRLDGEPHGPALGAALNDARRDIEAYERQYGG